MLFRLLKDIIGLIMLGYIFNLLIALFSLDKKNQIFAMIKEKMDGFYKPILNYIRSYNFNMRFHGSEMDISGFIFIFCLWFMQKILDILC